MDADPRVNPIAVEEIDGVDQDCDGVIDQGTTVTDDDGDGRSELGGDCDDANPEVRPGAAELPNGVDDDCDGTADDGAGDADGDGYPTSGGDCDDADGWSHPQAREFCDEVDNNCDGAIDEGCDTQDAIVTPPSDKPAACGMIGPGGAPPTWLALALLALRRRRA